MKRIVPLLCLAALCLTGCGLFASPAATEASEPSAVPSPGPEPAPTPAPTPTPEPTPTPPPTPEERAMALLGEMSSEEKVWQLFILQPQQLTAQSPVTEAGQIEKLPPVGGLLLNASNLVSREQTEAFIADLQARASLPLLVAVDEEGGIVARVGPSLDMTRLSSMYYYREQGPDTARENARALGESIASLGFNLDFAPVADVWTNPQNTVIGVRAYSDDPRAAAELVAAAVEGFHLGGVAATLKHFPGHGDTALDSHMGAVTSDKTLEALEACELLPFLSGMEAGADMVMTGHITLTAIDPERPATLSPAVVTGILREGLGYDGVVVTDALGMGAITESYGDEAALLALEAGCDLLLAPGDPAAAAALILERADMARIEESVLRILLLKLRMGLLE